MMMFSQTYGCSRALVGLAVALLLAGLVQGAPITVSPGESIQEAIDAASPGDTILVESGTYNESVSVNKSLILKGVGMPLIDTGRKGDAITLSADWITIDGFEVNNNTVGIYLKYSNNSIITGNKAGENDYGILLDSSNNNKITNNIVSYNVDGILLDSCNNNTLHQNFLINNVKYNAYDNSINHWDKSIVGNYYSDIDCADSDDDGTCDLAYKIPGGSSVDRYPLAFSERVVCPVGCHYMSIQAAIDEALDGETIAVLSGVYHENLNVTKKLTLLGVDNGDGVPVVDAGGNGSAITLYIDGIIFSGFEAVNSSEIGGAGMKILSNKNTIKNSNFNDNYYGIYLTGSNNNVIGNTAFNNSNGIHLDNFGNNSITGNNAINNNYGIYINGSSKNILYQNNLMGNRESDAYDDELNHWDNGNVGNYHSDFDCTDENGDHICDSVHNISGGSSVDRYPMVSQIRTRTVCPSGCNYTSAL